MLVLTKHKSEYVMLDFNKSDATLIQRAMDGGLGMCAYPLHGLHTDLEDVLGIEFLETVDTVTLQANGKGEAYITFSHPGGFTTVDVLAVANAE